MKDKYQMILSFYNKNHDRIVDTIFAMIITIVLFLGLLGSYNLGYLQGYIDSSENITIKLLP